MWINRTLEPRLTAAVRSRPVVVLTGARQTGKTSLLQRLFSRFHFVSLDLPSEAELAERDPQAFLLRHPPPLIIDEVQYAPQVFRHVKAAVDLQRSRPGKFVLTGSQKFTLMREIADSLAGRVEILELEPLSVEEISAALPGLGIEQLMLRGGFPELYGNQDLDSYSFYRSYTATYLERDVRTLLNVASLRDFERFLRACALRSAQLLNKADLARDVGISPSTANQWLSVLEASGQVRLLEPWFSNRTKSLVKSPKLYLADTGLLCALLNIQTVEELRKSPLAGALWETFVFAELRKRETARRHDWSLSFWHDRTREVDFLIDRGGRFELYEAKWSESPRAGDAANLAHLEKLLGRQRVLRQSLVCRARNPYPVTGSVQAVTIADL